MGHPQSIMVHPPVHTGPSPSPYWSIPQSILVLHTGPSVHTGPSPSPYWSIPQSILVHTDHPPIHTDPIMTHPPVYTATWSHSLSPCRKFQHCEVEKRRRERMNRYMAELAQMIPACSAVPRKLDKLSVLKMAVDHMKNLRGKRGVHLAT